MIYTLTDLVPLRTTAEWTEYETIKTIPVAFGDLTQEPVNCVPYNVRRTQWCPSEGQVDVISVYVDEQAITAWQADAVVDAAGRTITIITLMAPAPFGAKVSAGVVGIRHPDTGEVINSPVDLIWYILKYIAGKNVDLADLATLRAGFAGTVIAGVLDDNSITLRLLFSDIAQGIGAVWDGLRLWVKYPGTTSNGNYAAVLGQLEIEDLKLSARADDVAGRVVVWYDYIHATENYKRTIEQEIPGSDFLGTSYTVQSKWCRGERQADELCQRLLQRLGRQRLSVSLIPHWSALTRRLQPGDWITIQHPWLPLQTPMEMLVLSVYDTGTRQEISGEVLWGNIPTTRVVRTSNKSPVAQSAAVDIRNTGRSVILTVRDENGRAAPGAYVSMDGGPTLTTDKKGKVKVEGSKGKHTLKVEIEGYRTNILEIVL